MRKPAHATHKGGAAKGGKPSKPAKKAKGKPMSAKQFRAYLKYVNTHRAKQPHAAKTRSLSLKGAREQVKFGRVTPYTEAEKPRLVIDSYLDFGSLPAPVLPVDRASLVSSWPMYGNDLISDCTCATVGHQVEAWTAYADAGAVTEIPESSVISLYTAVTGYDPATGANDNGAVIQDVLAYWRKHGVADDPGRVLAFAQLKKLDSLTAVQQALQLFGSVYIGLNVPQSAMDQFDSGQPWTVVAGSPVEGGHAVPVQLCDATENPVGVVTWGRLQHMSWGFWAQYVEEAWVVITQDWLDKNGTTPDGLNLYQLGEDYTALTGDVNPFPAPVPPVPPAPAPVPPQPVPAPPRPVPVPPEPEPREPWYVRVWDWIAGVFTGE